MTPKRYRDRDDVLPPRGRREPGSIADGDAPLDNEPPNVTEAEPPSGAARGPDGRAAEEIQAAFAEEEAQQIEADIEELQRELATATDRHLRLAAEFDNYRKRVERERAETWVRAQADLAARVLETLDDLERVTQHAAAASAPVLLEGVQLLDRKLRLSLRNAGLEEVEAHGVRFDPNSMEAVAIIEASTAEEDDLVSDVFQKGYRFKGHLIRPARVRVKKHGA